MSSYSRVATPQCVMKDEESSSESSSSSNSAHCQQPVVTLNVTSGNA